MTAVPATHGAGVELTCDDCGSVRAIDDQGPYDAASVHLAITATGWSGSPYARGPHRCPVCGGDNGFPAPTPRRLARVSIALTSPAALVRVSGDLDRDVVADLRGALTDALAVRAFAVVDLTMAGAVVPAGLDTLVRARNAAWRKAGDLLLAAPSPALRTVLRQHSAFRMFDTVPQAITAAWTND